MKSWLTIIFKDLHWFNKLMLIFNLLVVAVLLTSCISAYVNPERSIYFAMLGLLYPVWLFANVAFMIYWAIQKKWHFAISMFSIILGILPLSRFIQVTLWQPEMHDENSFKVMSYNVRVFDLYNWSSNVKTKNKIVSFIEREQPDVICFQEYYRGDKIHFSVKDTLMQLLDMDYVSEHITVTKSEKVGPGKSYFGSAIFSKYPIIHHEELSFVNEKKNHFSFVDIVKNGDTIRLFNAHIGSMGLQNADYKLIGGDDNKKWSYEKQAKQDILQRMSVAFSKRSTQMATLLKYIKASPYATVLCMDMNDTPNSYVYHKLSKQMTDAFVKTGNGIGSTYVGDNFFNRILPVNRIDYIFFSEDMFAANFITHQEILSDHKAISCDLQLK